MDRKDMDFMSKMFAQLANYGKCIENKCKMESNAEKKATAEHKKKLESLRNDFLKSKITMDKYQKEVSKINSIIMDTEETKIKNECALKRCKTEFLLLLDTLITAMKKECKTTNNNSKPCTTLREFETLRKHVKEDKLTHEDLKTMMSKLSGK
jgi:predicted  nucleic acid-binding Zn-ribbon protein